MHFNLEAFQKNNGAITCIIHGNAKGADSWAKHFAIEVLKVPHRPFPARWDDINVSGAVIRYTRGMNSKAYNALAGHWRNEEMIVVGKPDAAMGFKGGPGTANMATRCERAGLFIWNAGYK